MMSNLTLPAPAKLNLFLHITGRRADGYHLLQTVFTFIDFADHIQLTCRDDGVIERLNGAMGVLPEHDLVVKAAKLLQQYTGSSFGATIAVDKRIPMGGGLGGGSSDAATVLHGLNHLWGCGLNNAVLAMLGMKLGADVPVFIHGHTAWAEGIGEILTPVAIKPAWYVVIYPRVHVPTAELFVDPDLTRDCHPITLAAFHEGETCNVFQSIMEKKFPAVAKAIHWLAGYANARLTGSGSCLFAVVNSKLEGDIILQDLPSEWFGFVAKGCTQSPLQQKLLELQAV